jgi:hypothetical protein
VDAVKFNHGDLVTIQINIVNLTNFVRQGSIGIIREPAKDSRGSNIVEVFGSDDNWYLKNNETDLLHRA